MAITVTELTAGASTSNVTTYTPASISPGANKLITCDVYSSRGGSTDPDVPTMPTSNGLTWVQIDTQLLPLAGTVRVRLTSFRAMAASTSSGSPSIVHASSCTGCAWVIKEWDGVDTGGTNGSAAVPQVAKNTSTASTSVTTTLGSALQSGSAHNAVFGTNASTTFTAEGSWTESPSPEQTYATPGSTMGGMYRLNTSDTTATGTFGASGENAGISYEIKAAAGGTPQLCAAVIGSTSTLAAALSTPKRLAATIDSSSSVAASASTPKRLSAVVGSVSTFAAALSASSVVYLAATIGSVSTVSASLRDSKPLAATIGSLSSLTASLRDSKPLAATIAGVSTVAGALTVGAGAAFKKLRLLLGVGR